jgi:ubiquinone/menaquinone biosynthesis C-methylase UbiE
MKTEREIPFESQMFDVIYANQVFEHVRFLDRMFEECVRVLKPGGTLITLFPVATYPLEVPSGAHISIRFWRSGSDGGWDCQHARRVPCGIGS